MQYDPLKSCVLYEYNMNYNFQNEKLVTSNGLLIIFSFKTILLFI